jgi:hypothetical protein
MIESSFRKELPFGTILENNFLYDGYKILEGVNPLLTLYVN